MPWRRWLSRTAIVTICISSGSIQTPMKPVISSARSSGGGRFAGSSPVKMCLISPRRRLIGPGSGVRSVAVVAATAGLASPMTM